MDLTSEVTRELRRPFTAAAVKFKPMTKPYDGKSQAAFFIDARLAAERLNSIVGAAGWMDSYRLLADASMSPALFYPVECTLIVCGVQKSDVGQGASTVVDDKAWKSAYSDALKRAAVKFGVGVYLYSLPRLWAPVDVGQDGKAKGFTKDAQAWLRNEYTRWLASPLNIYGEPFDHGDMEDADHAQSEAPAMAPYVPIPDARNTAAPQGDPDDPGQAVIFFKAHKGETIQQVWDSSSEEERKNGNSYINWLAHKSEPTTPDGEALKMAAQRFLQELENEIPLPEYDPNDVPFV